MRCEIVLSMAILNDPSHHVLQRDWFEKARDELADDVLRQIKDLFLHSSEAMMVRVLSRCDDSIESVLDYLSNLSVKDENEIFQVLFEEEDLQVAARNLNLFKEASSGRISGEIREFFYQEFGIQKDEEIIDFSRRYASPRSFIIRLRDTLSSYWNTFFKREWFDNLLQELKKTVDSIKDVKVIDVLSFMEEQTGKRFKEFSKIVVYVSHFIAPHGIGFKEKGGMAVVVDKNSLMKGGLGGAYHTIIHELLHPLMLSIRRNIKIRPYFEKLKENEELLRLYRETVMGRYGWDGFIEENLIAAIGRFLLVRLGTEEENEARKMLYTGLQMVLFDELIRNYNVKAFGNIDNFLIWFFKKRDLTKVALPQELQNKLFTYLSKKN